MRFTSQIGVPIIGLVLVMSCSSSPPAPLPVSTEAFDYEFVEYMPGLKEDARIVKTMQSVIAYLDDGRVVTQAELQVLEDNALHERLGALHPQFAEHLKGRRSEERIPVAFFFALDAQDTSTSGMNDALMTNIAKHRDIVKTYLSGNGASVTNDYKTIPVVLATVSVGEVARLARSPLFTRVVSAESRVVKPHSFDPNTISDAHIDTVFNNMGFFGTGQKIGNIEEMGDGIYDVHEAFSQAVTDPHLGWQVTYDVEPDCCNFDSDCPANHGANYPPGVDKCMPLHIAHCPQQCVNAHATGVLSVASARNGGTNFGAPLAQYYYANQGDPCTAAGILQDYENLVMAGVTTVNESFGCIEQSNYITAATVEGVTQDYFARYSNISISKAAGDGADDYGCDPACPYTLNSTCVGASNLGGARLPWSAPAGGTGVNCISSWTNNNGAFNPASGMCNSAHTDFGYGFRTDREEPDIAMFGGDGAPCNGTNYPNIAGITSPMDWTPHYVGTSFSAPAAASVTALCKQVHGSDMDEKSIRAILKSSAWTRNLANFNYSMASTNLSNPDWIDGGGGLTADALLQVCGGGPNPTLPHSTTGTNPGNIIPPGPYPGGSSSGGCPSCNANNPPLGGLSDDGIHVENATPPGATDGRHYYRLFSPVPLNVNDRIRVVIAWNSCPASNGGTATAPIKMDIDLFLFKTSSPAGPVDGSQSVMDVTEGFDVTIPASTGAGTYTVYWAAMAGQLGCGGTGQEPFAYAAWWGPGPWPTF